MTGHGKRPLNVSVLFRGCGFEICEWLLADLSPQNSEHIPDQGRNPRAPNATGFWNPTLKRPIFSSLRYWNLFGEWLHLQDPIFVKTLLFSLNPKVMASIRDEVAQVLLICCSLFPNSNLLTCPSLVRKSTHCTSNPYFQTALIAKRAEKRVPTPRKSASYMKIGGVFQKPVAFTKGYWPWKTST